MNSIDNIVDFDEIQHKYKFGDHQFSISVTGFTHEHFPEFNENAAIKAILGSKKMQDPSYEYYGMNEQGIKNHWDKGKELGTILHAQIEDYYNGRGKSFEEISTIEYRYFLNFAKDFSYINPYRTELRIFSLDLDIAGSIDLLIKNPDGTYFIMDWKRAKNIDISTIPNRYTQYGLLPGISHIMSTNYNHYCFQLNIYRYILQREYGFIVTGMALVVLHPNNKSGNYEIHSVPIMDTEMEYIMNIRLEKIRNSRHNGKCVVPPII